MANPPRTRKRVHAIRRAPDGSAFEKCHSCGVVMAVALADMHECGDKKKGVKRFRGICGKQTAAEQSSFDDQPRSPFRFFMEGFTKSCKTGSLIDIDRRAFDIWKNMSEEERRPYFLQAEKVCSAYVEALIKEANVIPEVDDEADSAVVGKFDKFFEDPEDYETSDSCRSCWSRGTKGLNMYWWKMLQSWMVENSD